MLSVKLPVNNRLLLVVHFLESQKLYVEFLTVCVWVGEGLAPPKYCVVQVSTVFPSCSSRKGSAFCQLPGWSIIAMESLVAFSRLLYL